MSLDFNHLRIGKAGSPFNHNVKRASACLSPFLSPPCRIDSNFPSQRVTLADSTNPPLRANPSNTQPHSTFLGTPPASQPTPWTSTSTLPVPARLASMCGKKSTSLPVHTRPRSNPDGGTPVALSAFSLPSSTMARPLISLLFRPVPCSPLHILLPALAPRPSPTSPRPIAA